MIKSNSTKIPSEAKIQSDCFQWLWNTYPSTRRLCFHIPNGGLRSAREAATFKAMGVVAGIPDLCLAIASSSYDKTYSHALYIEIKTATGKTSPEQEACHIALKNADNAIAIVRSLEEFKQTVTTYLANTPYKPV